MKRKFVKSVAALLVAVTALAPITAQAAELKTVKYNPEVTRSNGDLKLGYKPTDDTSKTWWKTETYYTDWKEATLEEYNAVKDDDLKKVDTSARTDWRKVDKNTYLDYLSKSPDDARTNGYTDYAPCDKATYDSAADDLRTIQYGDWQTCDKATYDAETDPDKKQMSESDWRTIGSGANWRDAYDEWLQYPEDSRRLGGKSDFYEVSKDEYTAFAEIFPGREGDLYYYEDDQSKKDIFAGWVFFDEQIIANVYNAGNGHDPFYVLVGEFNPDGSYSGCEGGTWDGINDGVRYLDFGNGGSAQNIADSVLDMLNSNGVPVITINGGWDIPALGANKYNSHNSDPNHNAGSDGGNGFIDIVDEDFKIYYYGGSDTINVQELYGVLIAPNATVEVGGKWIGTIIADTVRGAGNWYESAKWCYPIDKGEVIRKYYICNPILDVKDVVYKVRTIEYFVRDYVYEVRDVVKKYYVRSTEDKKFYCDKAPYVPKTGDLGSMFVLYGVLFVITIGLVLVIASSKKKRRS